MPNFHFVVIDIMSPPSHKLKAVQLRRFADSISQIEMLEPRQMCADTTVQWVSQIGTTQSDKTTGVAVDASGIAYIVGSSYGGLGTSSPNSYTFSAFLSRHNVDGTVAWTQEITSDRSTEATGVAVGASGSVYVVGNTAGSVGGPNLGDSDILLMKFDSNGTIVWARQFGTAGREFQSSLAVDASENILIGGSTTGQLDGSNAGGTDTFVAKYDSTGTQLWARQFGTALNDLQGNIAVDSTGNVYVVGVTDGSLIGQSAGNADAFLVKYTADGTQAWMKQFGTTGEDFSLGVATDTSGAVYVTGETSGNLGAVNAGDFDLFLSRFNSDGSVVWSTQFGTANADAGVALAVDTLGGVDLIGQSSDAPRRQYPANFDVFLKHYASANGAVEWSIPIASEESDTAEAIALDNLNNIFVTGDTEGSLGGQNKGGKDAFLIKFASTFVQTDDAGHATIRGSDGADSILVSLENADLIFTLNGTTESISAALVTSLTIDTTLGDDTIAIGAGVIGVTVQAGDGNDTLSGGDAADLLDGGSGDDLVAGGRGPDSLYGGLGFDTLRGGKGFDFLAGGNQGDLLIGATGGDTLQGGKGLDSLDGGEGDDQLTGGLGIDTIFGGDGNDRIFARDGYPDQVDGGLGLDVAQRDDTFDLNEDVEEVLA